MAQDPMQDPMQDMGQDQGATADQSRQAAREDDSKQSGHGSGHGSGQASQSQWTDPALSPQPLPQGPVHWIDFGANEVTDDGYTPVKDNVRGPYLPDQSNQTNRAAQDDGFNTTGVGGLAEGGGTYGAVGAGTSGGSMGRGDTGELGVMAGTDLSDTLGGPGAPDRTAGPQGSEPLGDIAEPEIQREEGTQPEKQ